MATIRHSVNGRLASRTGFTLIEMVVAMTILLIISLAMGSYVRDMIRSRNTEQATAEAFRRANLAAQYIAEQLRPSFALLDPAGALNTTTIATCPATVGTSTAPNQVSFNALVNQKLRWRDNRNEPTRTDVLGVWVNANRLMIRNEAIAAGAGSGDRVLLNGITQVAVVLGRNPAAGDWGVRTHRYCEVTVTATATVGGVTRNYTTTSNAFLRNSDP